VPFKPFITIFSLILLWLIMIPSAWALDVQDVRFGLHSDKTRLVVELNEAPTYRAFMLPAEANKPYRLVIDMPDFTWKAGIIPEQPKTTVTDVRSGSLKPDVMRLVIDLSKPALIQKAFLLPPQSTKPNRLVIDFKTVTATQFSQSQQEVFGDFNPGEIETNPQSDFGAFIEKFFTDDKDDNKEVQIRNGMVIPPRKPPIVSGSTAAPRKVNSPIYKPLIVIDAGHGGADPGAIGASRLREKNITLAAAKTLKSHLEATGRYRTALTRSDDTYLKLYKRVSIARAQKADLFISLHADSIDKPNVRGASIYTLSNNASDAQTAKLAKRENQADLIAGIDLSHEDKDVANILIDLAMRDTMNQSKFFANTVVTKMKGHDLRILPKTHRYAGFAVLKAPDIPSVLVEMGFMSNNSEAHLLATPDYQRKVAAALVDSIDAYFAKVRKNGL
jgi:N-acetylmuramoyl-L-alanine amidase